MKIKLIGTGAAGNKASIKVIETGLLSQEDVLLINSTPRDIDPKYRNNAYIFDTDGGCGKEAAVGASLTLGAIDSGDLADRIDGFVDEDTEAVVIVFSAEGGTGCGSAPEIASFIDDDKNGLGMPVMLFMFGGFREDGRGLQNTIEAFQKMKPGYTIQVISNASFLHGTDKLKAEQDANTEFVNRLSVYMGYGLEDSKQNMDETDLYKSSTQSGYMTILKTKIPVIKNTQQLDDIITEMIDTDAGFDTGEKGMKRLGVIVNMNPESQKYIDHEFRVIREKIGVPYEKFEHIQYNPEQEEYISFICSGMMMPSKEVESIYKQYQEESAKVNKQTDSFFEDSKKLEGDSQDNQFNTRRRRKTRTTNKEAFIEDHRIKQGEEQEVKEKSNFIKNNY